MSARPIAFTEPRDCRCGPSAYRYLDQVKDPSNWVSRVSSASTWKTEKQSIYWKAARKLSKRNNSSLGLYSHSRGKRNPRTERQKEFADMEILMLSVAIVYN